MKKRTFTILQIMVHIAGWTPLAVIVYLFLTDNLTANPVQAIEQRTGLTALTFLLLSLACTPLSSILGWNELSRRRKALGNYGFLYAALHVLTFVGRDYGFNFLFIWRDVGTKRYIIVGLIAFLLLLPLGITSLDYWVKRLGKKWKRLHMLVYIISPLVVFHFLLVVKGNLTRFQGDILKPLSYGAVVLILLVLRIPMVKKTLIRFRRWIQSSTRKLVTNLRARHFLLMIM
jgi:methionine sulfoxide reductase heme-binding subunit